MFPIADIHRHVHQLLRPPELKYLCLNTMAPHMISEAGAGVGHMLVVGMVVFVAFIGIVFVLSPKVVQKEAQFTHPSHDPVQPSNYVKSIGRELNHGT